MPASQQEQDTVRLVKDAAQITDIIGECITLKRAGTNLKGLCPFHAEKTPSFIVNGMRQTFHCFGCGEGGDVYSFMMKYHNMSFPEALKTLADRYHIQLPEKLFSPENQDNARKRQTLFDINNKAGEIFHDFLLHDKNSVKAREYLAARGVFDETIKNFRLGYAPDSWNFLLDKLLQSGISKADAEEAGLLVHSDRGRYYDRFRDRILFPIFNMTGQTIGFGGRILGEGEPKYLNSPETPVFNKSRTLFGLFQHKDSIRQAKRCVIVEGNFDLLSLAIHNILYAAAPLGTALTQAQIRILKGYVDEVILLFDGDQAGLRAAMRSVPLFLAEHVRARVALLPAGHDPDTYVRKHGSEGLKKYLDQAMPLPEFVFDQLVEEHGLTLEGKGRILAGLQPLLAATANDPLQRSVLISRFSERLQLDTKQVMEGLNRSVQRKPSSSDMYGRTKNSSPASQPAIPQKQKQLLEFLILYPEYTTRFIEAGIQDILSDPSTKTLLQLLEQLCSSDEEPAPERLLDLLPEGPERSFVTRLLISAQIPDEEEREALCERVAEEQLAWLKKVRLGKEIKQVNRQLEEARQARDDQLVLELSRQKIALNQELQRAMMVEKR